MKRFLNHLIKKHISQIVIIFFFLGMMNTVISYGFEPPSRLTSVSRIETQQIIYAREEIEIHIEGLMDCCAYIHSQAWYPDLQNREVLINIWEGYIPCLCIPTLVEYAMDVKIVFIISGNWKIRCNNMSIAVYVY
jgi:hypothetical protein